MDYINNFHWVWYGLGFVFCPKLTIMIMLSIYSNGRIPLTLMIIGWVWVVITSVKINYKRTLK